MLPQENEMQPKQSDDIRPVLVSSLNHPSHNERGQKDKPERQPGADNATEDYIITLTQYRHNEEIHHNHDRCMPPLIFKLFGL
jgi:hypothetical protein